MKRVLHTVIIFLFAFPVIAQERPVFNIPDIPGYKTLVCDFHLHTVFSDGLVWPSVRVDEAWKEGLDAIAITDHLEYLPHKADIITNYNRSWQIASEYAEGKNVILIPGTEITKGMPPGHFNALFIKDASLILNDDYAKAIEQAADQGAFIMWNHPGWKAQQPDTMKWWDEHTFLYDKGWLHGIEVANETEFYPAAMQWVNEMNLTVLGNSDQHEAFPDAEFSADQHRTCTFVFVTERSAGGIREALFNGRTAAYTGKKVVGQEALLKALFYEAVKLIPIDQSKIQYSLVNKSDLYFDILLYDNLYKDWEKKIVLKPGYEYLFKLPSEAGTKGIYIKVQNFISAYNEVLTIPFSEVEIVD